MTPGLATRDLVKAFRRRTVVNGISMSVARGEVIGLLGPNGAGKTTLFHLILGVIAPDAGSVTLDGEDITDRPMYERARRGIGYLPQEASVFRRMSVADNLRAVLQIRGLNRAEVASRTDSLLREFAIDHLAPHRAETLSGGERRRLEIARALTLDPSFILLDEPFAGIDPKSRTDIQTIIAQLQQRGIGVLITDHNVRETLQITDRAYIISEGRILAGGTPAALASSPEVRRIYLGENFSLP